VIGKEKESGTIPEAVFLKPLDESAEQMVHPGNHAPVHGTDFPKVGGRQFGEARAFVIEAVIGVLAFEAGWVRGGYGIAVVEGEPGLFHGVSRVSEMEGEKEAEGLPRGMGDDVERRIQEGRVGIMAGRRIPFPQVEAGLPAAIGRGVMARPVAGQDAGFPFVECGGHGVWGQDVVFPEDSRVIAALFQVSEEIALVGVQEVEQGTVAVGMGIEPRQEGTSGGGTEWVLSKTMGERDRLASEGIQGRRFRASPWVAEDGIATDRLRDEENHIEAAFRHDQRNSFRRAALRFLSSCA